MGPCGVGIVGQRVGQGGVARGSEHRPAVLPGQAILHFAAEQEVDEGAGIVLMGAVRYDGGAVRLHHRPLAGIDHRDAEP